MKYEVIGWTHVGNGMYPAHEHITASVDAAIIKEIREHKYLFGGDRHEDYCPVLNDGTYVSYSWRGWGRIIALAYGVEGDYSYMCAYMNSMIKPKALNYPGLDSLPKDHRIVPKESLAEIFVMHLADDMFEKVKAGTKTVEMRLFDDKRKLVDVGDYIEFRKLSDENERVLRRVAYLYPYESFKDAFENVYHEKKKRIDALRFTPEQLGAPENSDLKSLIDGMYKYYSKAQEKEHGVIAFTLEEPKHSCRISLNVMLYSPESEVLLYDKLADFDYFDEEYQRYVDIFYDIDSIKQAISEISEGFVHRYGSFAFEDYEDYDVDVNVMLRKMLKDLFGKEQKLKEITEKFLKVITLEIYAVIAKDSEEPKQNLSLDKDIIEFLHKSGVELKLETKII